MRVFTGTGSAAGTPAEIVAQLRLGAILWGVGGDSIEEYMAGVAERVAMWRGDDVCTDSPGAFLNDLDELGILMIEGDSE